MMKTKTLRTLALGAMVLGFAAAASADTIWTLNNVNFTCPNCLPGSNTNTVTGNFVAASDFASLVSWDIDVTGTHTAVNYHYTSTPSTSAVFSFSVNGLTLFETLDANFSPYLALVFNSPGLSNSVPTTIGLVAGTLGIGPFFGSETFTCNNTCGQLTSDGNVSGEPVATTSVPEPATLGLLGLGLAALRARKLGARKS